MLACSWSSRAIARLKSLTKPFLNWAGKAERQRISVPTIPLFMHERHSTEVILTTLEGWKRAGTQLDLFGDPNLDLLDQLNAYEHLGPWTNRMILGDSFQVMNSLLEYEGLGGQVQMIYMDPPYGVKFGSNFQPFVRKRDVKHGADDDMIREPETVTLVDRPELDKAITRVCGRFSVEATVQAAQTIPDGTEASASVSGVADAAPAYEDQRRYLDRMVEVLQRSRTLQLPGNESLGLEKVRALSGEDYEHLHAEAILQDGDGKRAAVLFGPEHSAISAAQVAEAHREAYNNGFDLLCIFGFAIDAKARELIGSPDDARRRLRLRCIYVNVTSDVVMSDLLKTNKSSEIFSVTGLTDVAVTAAGADPTGRPLYRAAVRGLRFLPPRPGNRVHRRRQPALLDAGHRLQRPGVHGATGVLPEDLGLGQPGAIPARALRARCLGAPGRHRERALSGWRAWVHRGEGD